MNPIFTSSRLDVRRMATLLLALALAYSGFARSATYDLLVSKSALRSSPVSLLGQTVSGNIYVFTSPDTGVRRVSFFLDGSATAYKTEGILPYDLAGTAPDGTAYPFNTATLPDGAHSLVATVETTTGTVETVTSSFTVSNATPVPASLAFGASSLSFSAVAGSNPPVQSVTLSASNGGAAAFTISENAAWLTVTPASGSTPGSLSLTVNTTGLAAGSYSVPVTASAPGYVSATLTVNLTVTAAPSGTYDVKLSKSASRSSPVSLAGQTVNGNIYVFTSPDTGVRRVSFYLDGSATAYKTEGVLPYDLAGTAPDGTAYPFNTNILADGNHSLQAVVELTAGGTETITSSFSVANAPAPTRSLVFASSTAAFSAVAGGTPATQSVNLTTSDGSVAAFSITDDAAWLTAGPASGSSPAGVSLAVSTFGLSVGTYTAHVTASAAGYTGAALTVTLTVSAPASIYDLRLSQSADRSLPVSLSGQTVSGSIYVFTAPDTGVRRVNFYLDASGTPYKTEGVLPFDLAGTAANGTAFPFNTATLSDGSHSLTATIETTSGTVETITAPFTVANAVAPSYGFYDFNNGDASGWIVVNDSTMGIGDWRVVSGQFRQLTDVGFYGGALQNAYHRGTYAYLNSSVGLQNYRFQVTAIPQSNLGRDIGVMFRYVDNNNYYRLYYSADDGGTRLEKKVNGVFTTLAKNQRGYQVGVPLNITVDVQGPLVQVGVNEDGKLFGFYDTSLQTGGVALYCRHACSFDNVAVTTNTGATSLVIAKPEAHSVTPGASVQASAVLLNKPAGSVRVDFSLGGNPCGSALEVPAASGQFQASCSPPPSTYLNDLSATLSVNGTARDSDQNVRVGTGGDNFLALGDSITFGLGDAYADDNSEADGWVQSTMGYSAPLTGVLNQTNPYPSIVFNNGFPGDRSSTVLNSRIDTALQRHGDANYVLMLLGTNDLSVTAPSGLGCVGNACSGTYKGNMQALVDKIVAAGKTPIIARVPPRFGDSDTAPYASPETAARNLLAQEYNAALQELGQNPQLGPDLYSFFLGAGVNRFSLFDDVVHPNALGYRVMAQLWYNHLIGGSGLPFILDSICDSSTGTSCRTPSFYKQDLVGVGSPYYQDASFTITGYRQGTTAFPGSLPTEIAGGVWIKTRNADKTLALEDRYLTFSFAGSATVYVAYDADGAAPNWLASKGFVDTNIVLTTSNSAALNMRLYRKTGVAGTISLGGNQATGATAAPENYVVIVRPQ